MANRIRMLLCSLGRGKRLAGPYVPDGCRKTPSPYGLRWNGLQGKEAMQLLLTLLLEPTYLLWSMSANRYSISYTRKLSIGKPLLCSLTTFNIISFNMQNGLQDAAVRPREAHSQTVDPCGGGRAPLLLLALLFPARPLTSILSRSQLPSYCWELQGTLKRGILFMH